jgi:hypothetical protein
MNISHVPTDDLDAPWQSINSFICYWRFLLTFTRTPSSCPGSTKRCDGQIPLNSFSSKAFIASWCGGTQFPILRSCCCCFFIFFSTCICIGLLCFKKCAPIQKTILLQLQKDMCEFGLIFVFLSVGCEGRWFNWPWSGKESCCIAKWRCALVKATKFTLRFIYIFSIHCRF